MTVNQPKSRFEQGWQRVKEMWDENEPALEVEYLPTIAFSSSFTAFILAGLVGAQQTAENFRANSKFRMFPSKVQALREMHSHALLGFVRSGSKAGWRACIFAVTFTLLSGSLNAYFNKIHVLNYTAAGSFTGTLLKLRQGPRGIVVGLFAGSVISLPVGLCAQGLHSVLPQSYYDSLKEDKLKRKKEREEDWQSRLSALSRMIDSMKSDPLLDDNPSDASNETNSQEAETLPTIKDQSDKSKKE
ncbi:Complex I assembly factor TIMMDC1, mitochondrial [Trichoplax sp. H2]|nr:Complex I assembly factor TIMMDC1, mitochondrial [Trichoplax sp. H2]|eukprot:RDD37919.1 Complex I assembly factor TIMMDC1, mitochondrial [Trichoplax sp. H2]